MPNDYRQARLLVELAATTAQHGEALLRATAGLSKSGIESYWLASRNRQEAWLSALKQLDSRACFITAHLTNQEPQRSTAQLWEDFVPVAEEILSSEILTRIWTAIGCELDRRNTGEEVEPFVRSILSKHLECRRWLLRLAFEKMVLPASYLKQLDKTRRRVERWNDVLLGYLAGCSQVDEFAFDVDRVHDFESSLRSQDSSEEATKALLMVSLRSTFDSGYSGKCPNPRLNARICESVLACFGSDILEATGMFHSVWETRLEHAANDTQSMIDCLAAEHEHSFFHAPTPTRDSR